ncbi:MAG: hypothetical protein WCF67_06490 [Chitinophagaceae bacterium]
MNEKLHKLGRLNLGRELSRSEQKKILGGLTLLCSDGSYFTGFGGNCAEQRGYCSATGHGTCVACNGTSPC